MKIKEIAKLAGVSISTVSRVTNGYTNVPKETYDKVMKVINKYGYVPNASARILTGKINKTLGLFIVELKAKNTDNIILPSPWFTNILSAIVNYASNSDYNILVTLITNKKNLKKAKEMFINQTICGGIFVGAEEFLPEIDELDKLGYKIALLEQKKQKNFKGKNSIFVNSNNINGAYAATKALIEKGHSNIIHLSGNNKKSPTADRINGYKKALQEFEIPYDKNYVICANFQEKEAYSRIKEALENELKFTAIFAANDDMALGAITAIKEKGLKVPEDISIIGYDDTILAQLKNFSSVKAHVEDMAEILVNNLIKIIENPDKTSPSFIVDSEVVFRDSIRDLCCNTDKR